MNILLSFLWSPYTTAAYYAKAFRELGHDVRTVGPHRAGSTNMPINQLYRVTPSHDVLTGEGSFSGPIRYELLPWKPDIYIWIEAGGRWRPIDLPMDIPTIGYFIDSHSQIAWHERAAPKFNYRFCAQRQYADALGATWLPMACDPRVHTPTVNGEPEYDVAFVGNTYGDAPLYAKRREVLGKLTRRYRCNFQSGVYFEDMANVYASARVAFNISASGDLNMRVFEAMCSGRPLVTDRVEGLEDAESPRANLLYTSEETMFYAMEQVGANTEAAKRLGANGRAEVLAHHTYKHRAAQMLAEVGL